MKTVYPIGTTLYQPDRCANGYTLLWRPAYARLIDMNGRTVNEWRFDHEPGRPGPDRAHLLADGNLLVQRGGMMSTSGAIEEYDWDHDLVWQWIPEGKVPHERYLGPHHDVWRAEGGNTLTICRHAVPPERLGDLRDPRFRNETIYGDVIVEVDRDGQVVWEWFCHDHLDLDHPRILASKHWPPGPFNSGVCDWTHVNTVRTLPPNRWHDAGDERFRPGNVLISPRQLDTIYLIDHETGQIVWSYSGDYNGGLSGQHEPYMIGPDLPGAGNILIFDNGASPWNDLAHAGASYVLEIDPVTQQVVWVYDQWLRFHATFTSSAQRLANGNTLICESSGGRVFEVTPDGETVWEHVGSTPRSYRYAYDHCPQTAALGRPKEVSVTPPAELRIGPDEPLDGPN